MEDKLKIMDEKIGVDLAELILSLCGEDYNDAFNHLMRMGIYLKEKENKGKANE